MDIRALRYFVTVVDQQSFTKAANALHLTQPTVSKMVQVLEHSFGVPLLAREGKRFSVTEAGDIVYQRAKQMIAVHARMKQEVDALQRVERGVLRMGLSPSTHSILAPVFAAYHAAYPNIELKLFEIGSNDTLGHLRDGVLEMGTVLDFPGAGDLWSEFESLPLFKSPMCLLAPRQSPWQGRASVALEELADSEFILYGDAFALNDMVTAACSEAGFTPKVSGRSGQWDFMASLVGLGVGVALLPKVFCDTLAPEDFTIAQVGSPALSWNVSLAWRRDGHLSFAAKAWLELARRSLQPR
ncbi:LysR family transcriptional regulator [Pseudomonas cremoricolorata]|uniref:LysR family transcriptional regulator n=1 Tax=Pseudomonas cremoricolorata TaxID=157783 RepID=A0A089WGS0_9PSED|nr:LysR family transcriptional regulator [Pseudomonas cremoricolorata]AIR87786.1 LysR family transcriptional regulator [Pseudomonas cremoricolorata]